MRIYNDCIICQTLATPLKSTRFLHRDHITSQYLTSKYGKVRRDWLHCRVHLYKEGSVVSSYAAKVVNNLKIVQIPRNTVLRIIRIECTFLSPLTPVTTRQKWIFTFRTPKANQTGRELWWSRWRQGRGQSGRQNGDGTWCEFCFSFYILLFRVV